MDMGIRRFEIYLINLDPTVGAEINKSRPCVVISPDVMNNALDTVIIAPLTSTIRTYPSRVNCNVAGKTGQVCLDQIRSVDQTRLYRRIGTLETGVRSYICDVLIEMFEL